MKKKVIKLIPALIALISISFWFGKECQLMAESSVATSGIIVRRLLNGASAEAFRGPTNQNEAVREDLTVDSWVLTPIFSSMASPITTNLNSFRILEGIRGPNFVDSQAVTKDHYWFLANPPGKAENKIKSRAEAWHGVYEMIKKWRANGDLDRVGIDYAEPNLILETKERDRMPKLKRANNRENEAENRVYRGATTSPHWPAVKVFDWQFGDNYSQLRAAAEKVHQNGTSTNLVKVILLDTGVHSNYAILPELFEFAAATNIFDFPSASKDWNLHGTATTSILGGRKIKGFSEDFFPGVGSTRDNPEFEENFGAVPWLNITTFRIHDSVVHIDTTTMAKGITMAADEGADVISISHGGVPSLHWAEAVNHAYEKGSAIFAASGDYLDYIVIHSPHYVVYPAAFSRVMCVPGVTASFKSYGLHNNWFSLFLFTRFNSWSMRGNFGPRSDMGNAVCGFSPNIPWPGESPNTVDLDGSGTSACAPQVAAAAALWLQAHAKDQGFAAVWRTHHKVDAVYYALTQSANTNRLRPRFDPLYFGCGTVAALRALDEPFAPDRPNFQKADIELLNLLRLLTDWFGPETGLRVDADNVAERSLQIEALQVALESKDIQELRVILTSKTLSAGQQKFLQKRVRKLIRDSKDSSPELKARLSE